MSQKTLDTRNLFLLGPNSFDIANPDAPRKAPTSQSCHTGFRDLRTGRRLAVNMLEELGIWWLSVVGRALCNSLSYIGYSFNTRAPLEVLMDL